MYVDCFFKRGGNEEIIKVVERVNGQRVYKEYAPDYHFYINDSRGTHKTIYGNYVKKVTPRSFAEKQKLIKTMSGNVVRWESDVDPVFRCLEQNYKGAYAPKLHIAFFDIETSYDKETGWSDASVAANYITSISIYLQWVDEMVCLALPPETLNWEEAQEIADRVAKTENSTVVLVKTEAEMLSAFMDIVEDADILSGWNSEAFDIPYTINRIRKVLGKHEASRLCLWNQNPKSRTFDRGGKEQVTYDLIGRNHADYLQLYQKYTYEEKQSYALDSIAEAELGERKVQYDGTLDELYHDDFEKFLEYNIQDTRLLDKLDKKLQFIDLANNVAHENCVLLQTTMGAVAVTDQAVLMEAHSHGLVCQDKKRDKEEEGRAAGGWVATPKKGLHQWIGSVDLNSLYPSTIRAFNMSPETIVGQIRLTRTNAELDAHVARGGKYTFAGWWNDRYNVLEMDDFFSEDIGTMLTLDMENGDSLELSAKELRDLVFSENSTWCISANGTIFRTDIDGMIPKLLSRWYAERKSLQKRAAEILQINLGLELPEQLYSAQWPAASARTVTMQDLLEFKSSELHEILETADVSIITEYLNTWGLAVTDGKIQPTTDNETAWSDVHEYFDKKQHVRKISLNSAYGALLNMGSRFYDQRIGQSTTLSGRSINRHQASKINELLTGEYREYGETQIYCDTDSVYFSAYPIFKAEIDRGELSWTKDDVIGLYDSMVPMINASFPVFLRERFNVPEERSTGVIKCGREIVAETGIWMVKKRYACLMIDKDGNRYDTNGKPGKVKAMGLDLRRSDTPKFMQEFLSEILLDTLTNKGENYVVGKVRDFKTKFEDMKPWQQGTPKKVNKLSYYRDKIEDAGVQKLKGVAVGNLHVPGHVTASLNWNRLREIHNDHQSTKIIDGQRIIVCKLRITPDNNMTSIAYPVDETRLPEWFVNLPFDTGEMMGAIVDKKVSNLLSVLKWDFSRAKKEHAHLETLFDFS